MKELLLNIAYFISVWFAVILVVGIPYIRNRYQALKHTKHRSNG